MKSLPFSLNVRYKTYLYSPEFSQAAMATLGEIDVDPCAGPSGQYIEAATMWTGLTAKTDGYNKPWKGNVFFNCDNYERPLKNKTTGELIPCPHQFHKMTDWVTKFSYEIDEKRTKQAIGFFPCRMFKPWAHALYPKMSAVCYHGRNLSFYICERSEEGEYATRKADYNNVGDGYMSVLFSDSVATLKQFVANYAQYGSVNLVHHLRTPESVDDFAVDLYNNTRRER